MRTLKLSLLPLVLLGQNGWCETQTISLNSQYHSLQGALNPTALLNNPTNSISELRSVLGYKISEFAHGLTASGSFAYSVPDYSGYLLTGRNGEQIPLSQSFNLRQEFSGSLSVDWTLSENTISVGWSGNLSPSPFYSQGFATKYTRSFFNKTTLLSTQLGWNAQNQPATYYIDPNFRSKLRPATLHSLVVGAGWDQILTEKWKTAVQLTTSARYEDRPQNIGVTLKQGYAIGDRVFSQVSFSTVRELTSEALKDDRGYYSLNAVQGDLTYEPWIDCLITASYALVVESEFNPVSGNQTQIGSDQFGLALNYRNRGWGFDVKTAYHLTNTQLSSLDVSGGLTWQI